LGWKEVPVLVQLKPYNQQQATIASVSENLHRKPVVAGDMSDACDYLMHDLGSLSKVAKRLGVSAPTVKKYLGYRGVAEEIKEFVRAKQISVSDAIRLAQYAPSVKKAVEFANKIAKLPKPARERHFLAFIEEPNAAWEAIHRNAEKLRYKTALRIYLPEAYAHGLAKASADQNREPESIAQSAIIAWLHDEGYVH
jgi:ParB-like chromosome segregation protein Spo0J